MNGYLLTYIFLIFEAFTDVLGIYDGKVTTILKHPYIAAVDLGVDFMCPAVIIDKQWVIYDADCSYSDTPDELQVLVGSGEKWRGTSYQVEEIHVHPNYSYGSLDYNYALLKIEGEFTFSRAVKKAKLPSKEVKAGTKLTILGWGGPNTDNKLRQAKMKVLSKKECETYYPSTTFTSRIGCLYSEGGATACSDDYSDPVTKGDVLYHLVLTLSDSCDSSAGPILTAAVYPAMDWIKNITGIE